MQVAIVGGGLQGCTIALALAERGARVSLYDLNKWLLSRTAIANEGKVHLGYMYANDQSMATARMMVQGALAFAPFFERHLGLSAERMAVSAPATYVVHRDSQRSAAEVSSYLGEAHRLVEEGAQGREKAYFGVDLGNAVRPLSASELTKDFDPAFVSAAFSTPEMAINPVELANRLRERIADEPRIAVYCNHRALRVATAGERMSIQFDTPSGPETGIFDHVVNAAWDGRLALDASMDLHPSRPWLHRLKYGVSFRQIDGGKRPPSVTVISGPFGEVVSYVDGLTYLTWYPECVPANSREIEPPDWERYPGEPDCSRIAEGTRASLAAIVPDLRAIRLSEQADLLVKGGTIVAWGETDIDDSASELHRRFEIGVTTTGRYHSVDTGKLTMAPYFAKLCAQRIL